MGKSKLFGIGIKGGKEEKKAQKEKEEREERRRYRRERRKEREEREERRRKEEEQISHRHRHRHREYSKSHRHRPSRSSPRERDRHRSRHHHHDRDDNGQHRRNYRDPKRDRKRSRSGDDVKSRHGPRKDRNSSAKDKSKKGSRDEATRKKQQKVEEQRLNDLLYLDFATSAPRKGKDEEKLSVLAQAHLAHQERHKQNRKRRYSVDLSQLQRIQKKDDSVFSKSPPDQSSNNKAVRDRGVSFAEGLISGTPECKKEPTSESSDVVTDGEQSWEISKHEDSVDSADSEGKGEEEEASSKSAEDGDSSSSSSSFFPGSEKDGENGKKENVVATFEPPPIVPENVRKLNKLKDMSIQTGGSAKFIVHVNRKKIIYGLKKDDKQLYLRCSDLYALLSGVNRRPDSSSASPAESSVYTESSEDSEGGSATPGESSDEEEERESLLGNSSFYTTNRLPKVLDGLRTYKERVLIGNKGRYSSIKGKIQATSVIRAASEGKRFVGSEKQAAASTLGDDFYVDLIDVYQRCMQHGMQHREPLTYQVAVSIACHVPVKVIGEMVKEHQVSSAKRHVELSGISFKEGGKRGKRAPVFTECIWGDEQCAYMDKYHRLKKDVSKERKHMNKTIENTMSAHRTTVQELANVTIRLTSFVEQVEKLRSERNELNAKLEGVTDAERIIYQLNYALDTKDTKSQEKKEPSDKLSKTIGDVLYHDYISTKHDYDGEHKGKERRKRT